MDSHLMTEMLGYGYVSTVADWVGMLHAQAYLNYHRPKGAKPIELPYPWSTEPKTEQVTDEERARLRAQLQARSAFRD